MPSWIEALVIKLVQQYLTPTVIKEFEHEAAVFVVAKLREFAKSTEQTKVDDALVEIVAAALGVP